MRAALGIDVGTRSITVAEVRVRRGRAVVTNFGGVDLPRTPDGPRSVVERARALRQLLDRAGIRHRRAWFAVHDPEQTVDPVAVGAVRGRRLETELRYLAADRVGDDPLSRAIDVHLLHATAADGAMRRRRGLLVTAPRGVVADVLAVAQRADLRPLGVDLDLFALLRAVGRPVSEERAGEVLVDLGAAHIGILVHRGGVPVATHIIGRGIDTMVDAIAVAERCDATTAETKLQRVRIGGDGGVVERVATEAARALIDDIRSTLLRLFDDHVHGTIDVVRLVGGGARLAGMAESVSSVVHAPVTIGDPFTNVPSHRLRRSPASLAAEGPQLAAAIGLARNAVR
ncbi:MAG: pilus assembly protein PilM [Nitriliruptoraceae bacterium]